MLKKVYFDTPILFYPSRVDIKHNELIFSFTKYVDKIPHIESLSDEEEIDYFTKCSYIGETMCYASGDTIRLLKPISSMRIPSSFIEDLSRFFNIHNFRELHPDRVDFDRLIDEDINKFLDFFQLPLSNRQPKSEYHPSSFFRIPKKSIIATGQIIPELFKLACRKCDFDQMYKKAYNKFFNSLVAKYFNDKLAAYWDDAALKKANFPEGFTYREFFSEMEKFRNIYKNALSEEVTIQDLETYFKLKELSQ